MNKKVFICLSLTTIFLGGMIGIKLVNNTTVANNNYELMAEQPEGLSSISFALPTTSTTAYNSDGTHDTSGLSLNDVVNGSNGLIVSYSDMSKVYPGNSSGGYGTSTTTLKFGSSSAYGSMTINTNYSIHKVVINYATWSASNASRLSVNGVNATAVARTSFADETFVLTTDSNAIIISTITAADERVGIARIDLYHRCGL